MYSTRKIVVTCAPAISSYLANEVKSLGLPISKVNKLNVETYGDLVDAMRLNLNLRTGNRVLFQIRGFEVINADELYRKCRELKWEEYIKTDGYFRVDSFVLNKTITDPRFASLRVKDAIADRFMRKFGKRPDSGKHRDALGINIHWIGEDCAVYIDTSGETLSKHGYRKIPLNAPMAESLASGVIMAIGWNGQNDFVNPMCGSGTLAIEAALIAINRVPGSLRKNFSFMHLKKWDSNKWLKLTNDAKKSEKTAGEFRIIATDHNQDAILAAKKNAEIAGVKSLIEFETCDFKATPIDSNSGVILLNPEYGERLGDSLKLEKTYRDIGDFFKQKCQGNTGYIFTGNLNLVKKVGLRTQSRTTFFNGKIECRLLEYQLYEGSLKKGK